MSEEWWKVVDTSAERIAHNQMSQRIRKFVQRKCKLVTKSEVSERFGEVVDWLVEESAKREVCGGWVGGERGRIGLC